MPSPFNPQGLHGSGTALVHGQAVGEIDDLILCPVNDQHRRGNFRDLVNAGESIETVRFPGIRKSHAQTGHQRRVENDGCALVPGGQVDGGDGPNALTVQNDVLRTHAIPAEVRGSLPLVNKQQKRTKPTLP